MDFDPLTAVSSVDGRYRTVASRLTAYFSESALIKARVEVECKYLEALSKKAGFSYSGMIDADVVRIKEIEKETNHDVKAVEYYLREKLPDLAQWIHFGLTSEDINSLSYAIVLKKGIAEEIVPTLEKIRAALDTLAITEANTVMLARTHGQAASPTTFGKEVRVFERRLARQIETIAAMPTQAKFSGATGNWSAHHAALPKVDWHAFSKKFVESFDVEFNDATTQIEPHDGWAELFDAVKRADVVLLDLSQDLWRYVSDGWLVQRPKEGEVGSSTMPHKVNPIDFENAEGNLGVANALFEFYGRKLPISRLQRDLSDSTVARSFGEAFGHALIGYESILKGLGKLSVNRSAMMDAVDAHPEVLAEAIQTILRREGVANAYELLKGLTRGAEVTMDSLHAFIDTLPVSDAVKKELLALTPASYTGLAEKIARAEK